VSTCFYESGVRRRCSGLCPLSKGGPALSKTLKPVRLEHYVCYKLGRFWQPCRQLDQKEDLHYTKML
jgi:hypothetical protein